MGSDHSKSLQALMRPARVVSGDVPVPLHLASGNRLRVDVPAGEMVTANMVEPPSESALWSLRAEQDARFLR